jgi:hypothetical protein
LLDELPPDNPLAIQSRRDLRRVNRWMRHPSIMASALRTAFGQKVPASLIEIGAGDGTFLLAVAQRLWPHWTGIKLILLDRQKLVVQQTLEAFQQLGWFPQVIQADLLEWLATTSIESVDAIVANLFLHHFSADQLAQILFGATRRARVILALEPRRGRLSLLFSHLLWFIGCNQITRHDAVTSVRAGFTKQELSTLVNLLPELHCSLIEKPAGLFSHLFVASRNAFWSPGAESCNKDQP